MSSKAKERNFPLIYKALFIWGLFFGLFFSLPGNTSAHTRYQLRKLFYLSKVIFFIDKKYINQEQINPKKMFVEALKMIQKTVPAIMVKFSKDGKSVELYVDRTRKRFYLQPFSFIFSVPYQLRPIFAFIERHYRGEVELRNIEFAAIHGILSTLDPYTSFLPPSYYEDMKMHTTGSFGGLGIIIQSRDGFLTVVTPIPDTPAERAGLKPMDRIVRIGDESTINMSLQEAVTRLRGKPGTTVEIWVMRKGFRQPKKFVITRAIIRVKSVTYHALPSNIGYIKIKNFQKDTYSDVRKALATFHRQKGGLKGLIIDLRNNHGGLLKQSVKISDLFLSEGEIVTHEGGASEKEVSFARPLGTEPFYPIAILVNRGSASASEILAGALKNNNRAVLIGQKTYGKGTVQVLYPISPPTLSSRDFSALKLTVAQYLTPGGISIQDIGITPDIALNAVTISKKYIHFFDFSQEVKRKKFLPYLKGHKEPQRPFFNLYYLEKEKKSKEDEIDSEYRSQKKFKWDFESRLAHQLLVYLLQRAKQRSKWSRTDILSDGKPLLKKLSRQEEKKIIAALRKVGVDWRIRPVSGPVSQVKLRVKYRVLPPRKRKKGEHLPKGLDVWAGSHFRLRVTVKNLSEFPIYRLRAYTSSNYWFLNRHEFIFGYLKPKASHSWTVEIKLPVWVKCQFHKMSLVLKAEAPKFKREFPLTLNIRELPSPHYGFTIGLEELAGNGDFLVQPGEKFAVTLTAANFGSYKSPNLVGLIKNKTGRALFIQTGRINFKTLKPKQIATGKFLVKIPKNSNKKKLKFQVTLYDTELRKTITRQFELPVVLNSSPPVAVKDKKRLFVSADWAWVYAAPSFHYPKIAAIRRGTKLTVLARYKNFYKIRLPHRIFGRFVKDKNSRRLLSYGWILRSELSSSLPPKKREASKNGRNPFGGNILSEFISKRSTVLLWQVVPPKISVQISRCPLVISDKNFTLSVEIRNNKPILDSFIMVNGDKVFYRALHNSPHLKIEQNIELKEGLNKVQIFARESIHLMGYKELYIYRQKSRPVGKKLTLQPAKKARKSTTTTSKE